MIYATIIIAAAILAWGIAYAGKNIGIGLIRFGEKVDYENYRRKTGIEKKRK